ncbi:protein FAR1-RELATED SEQUENCE 5-like [Aegilops tauschii subsp. strangulata]|uniref:protein FAR1-RELATED SEQUENCE 5-like n=1 Tax=Aegilops tauschii subsp. strangulata TaxID=200361 RepID=UPI003CC8D2CC
MADEELTDIMVDMEFGELMKDWIEDWSDDENSDREDRSENGNEWDDLNIDELDDDQENNSKLSNEDYISQIMEMTFTSHDAAYNFYNSYARDNGFSIRKNKVRYSKMESRHMRYRRFVCSRQGKRDNKLLTEEGHSRRLRAETRCFCEAHLTVKLDQKRGVWYVESFEDKHSHMLAGPDEVPFLWSHRKIKEYQKHEIMSMGAAEIRIHDMMDCFISKHVWYGGVGFTRREIYNLCAKEKRKLLSKGDAATAIGIMASRKQRDPSFIFEYKLDKEGHLNRMFWCDSQSRHDYEDFGDVLVFDSTYKMNRYGMPFIPFVGLNNHRKTTVFGCAIVSDETEETYVWLLQTFLRSMCQKMPKSVITDADAAMIKAIREVLPDVWHRICTWHIEKNMKIHLSHKSLKEFRTLLYYSTSTATFEERWHAFSKRWQSDVTWLRRMYKKRRLWVAAYLTEGFWLGMKSNQRSESLNSCLHLHLDGEMTPVDMILHYENAVVRIRENEARDDCTASQSLPVPVTSSRELEIAASHVFTPANFYMLQDDLRKIDGMEIVEIKLGDGSQQYIVAWKNNRKRRFWVEYTPVNSAETIRCSCRRMIRKGLPWKHIFHILKHLNISEIPKCLVLVRFTKEARLGLPARRTSDLLGFGWTGAGERMKYSQVSVLASEAMHAACKHPALWDQLQESLKAVIAKSHEYDLLQENLLKQTNDISKCAVEYVDDGKGNMIEVKDPMKVSSKGATKVDESRPVSKNGRPLSFDELKTRCGACKLVGHTRRSKKCKLNQKKVEKEQE